jgi:hypothetical protein
MSRSPIHHLRDTEAASSGRRRRCASGPGRCGGTTLRMFTAREGALSHRQVIGLDGVDADG